ncbi:hypothetical protein Ae201684P_002822 [Aphanomyces euteiches]|uniref:Transmembrane protein n=1 Tax=Aphanomyces euteiches TaxID=100861 RepID=A0A6G0X5V9_9STRA|nr:hypothetical protein Ae201684_008403 [Aphanomyces euteiches]KAH9070464.1 hypothetical protein Ae201684P_002822 [Aphanomyces euteiches]KAH9152347.1 hypothetical protein AeRB84_005211 [Aphanomyces euteiches]
MHFCRFFLLCFLLACSAVIAADVEKYRNLRSIQAAPLPIATSNATKPPLNLTALNSTGDSAISSPRPLNTDAPYSTNWLLIFSVASVPLTILCIMLAFQNRCSTKLHRTRPRATVHVVPPGECPATQAAHRLSSSLIVLTPRPATPVAPAYSNQLEDGESDRFTRSYSFTSILTDPSEPSAPCHPPSGVGHESSRPSRAFSWTSNPSETSDPGYGGWWGRGSYLVL